MKIRIDIPESLLRDARNIAAHKGTTLSALVEQGLRQVIEASNQTFRLRKASFKGRGLRPELRNATGEQLLTLAYESRGG